MSTTHRAGLAGLAATAAIFYGPNLVAAPLNTQELTDLVQQQQQQIDALDEQVTSNPSIHWNGGAPSFTSADGKNSFAIGGRVQYDASTTFGSDYKGHDARNISGSEFRRARLGVNGVLDGYILYKLEADFAGGKSTLNDAFIGFKHESKVGTGFIYLGHKLGDRGLSGSTSTNWTWFTERNTVANTITADAGTYNTGLTGIFQGHDWHYSLGLSKGSSKDAPSKHSNDYLVRTRAHWNPVHTDNTIVHIGANGFYETFRDDPSISSKGMIAGHYNGNVRVASDDIDNAKNSTGYGAELALIQGRWAAGAEWGQRKIKSNTDPSMDYTAWSGQIGYSLTGEPMAYSTKTGAFGRMKVDNPVNQGGWGAWQIMARYEGISHQHDSDYTGGKGHGATAGLSWYPSASLRGVLEYTRWHTNNRGNSAFGASDDGNTINLRTQIVF